MFQSDPKSRFLSLVGLDDDGDEEDVAVRCDEWYHRTDGVEAHRIYLMSFAHGVGDMNEARFILGADGEKGLVGVEKILAADVDLDTTLALELGEQRNELFNSLLSQRVSAGSSSGFGGAELEVVFPPSSKRLEPKAKIR